MFIMATTNVTEVKRLSLTLLSRTYRYGPDDPRTVRAARELAEARIAVHETAIAELRRSLAGLPDMAVA